MLFFVHQPSSKHEERQRNRETDRQTEGEKWLFSKVIDKHGICSFFLNNIFYIQPSLKQGTDRQKKREREREKKNRYLRV